ncbi:MAG: epoxyqueuosine reductase QueH [Acidobacteriota bacterium]
MKEALLVHICCAPDSIWSFQVLMEEYEPVGYFFNPNIFPLNEYVKRLKETEKASSILNFKLIEGERDYFKWFGLTKELASEPEMGKRCDICYEIRLRRTAEKALELGIKNFTTVMSNSPWKKVKTLNNIGKLIGDEFKINFLEKDFKKKDGFKKSVELCKIYQIYRQNYCGCIYSLRDRLLKDR